MNKWLRRAIGTVGIAGGALLFGAGTAHADDTTTAATGDAQLLHGLVEQYFSPMSGISDTAIAPDAGYAPEDGWSDPDAADPDAADPDVADPSLSGAGVSVDTPGQRTTAGMLPGAPPLSSGTNDGRSGVVLHAPTGSGAPRDVFFSGRTPDMFQALPVTRAVPSSGLGLPSSGSGGSGTESTPIPVEFLPAPPTVAVPNTQGLPVGHGLPTTGGLPVGNGLPTTGGLPLAAAPEAFGLGTTARSVAGSTADPFLALARGGTPRPAATSAEAGAADTLPADTAPADPARGGTGFNSGRRLPVLGGVFGEPVLPMRGNLNTLPDTAPIPLGGSAPTSVETSARDLSTNAAGLPVQPELGEGLPVVSSLTGGGLPLVGDLNPSTVVRGGLPTHGGAKAEYVPRHAAPGYDD